MESSSVTAFFACLLAAMVIAWVIVEMIGVNIHRQCICDHEYEAHVAWDGMAERGYCKECHCREYIEKPDTIRR